MAGFELRFETLGLATFKELILFGAPDSSELFHGGNLRFINCDFAITPSQTVLPNPPAELCEFLMVERKTLVTPRIALIERNMMLNHISSHCDGGEGWYSAIVVG